MQHGIHDKKHLARHFLLENFHFTKSLDERVAEVKFSTMKNNCEALTAQIEHNHCKRLSGSSDKYLSEIRTVSVQDLLQFTTQMTSMPSLSNQHHHIPVLLSSFKTNHRARFEPVLLSNFHRFDVFSRTFTHSPHCRKSKLSDHTGHRRRQLKLNS